MTKIPKRYIPEHLSKKDKKTLRKQLKKSRKEYTKKKYHLRKNVKSFKSKISPHIVKAKKIYKISNIKPSTKLANATKCSISSLRQIVKKGKGAYYSSGSRPNQTPHSWGYARLASAITGGNASIVDINELKRGCKKNSKALKLAKKAAATRKIRKTKKTYL